MKKLLAALFLTAFALAPYAAEARPQSAPHEFVTFADLGYDSIVLGGDRADTFSIFVPIYPELKKISFVLPLTISPLADPASTISVSVGGVPLFSQAVRTLGRTPRLVIPLTSPALRRSRLAQVSVSERLFVMRDHCEDPSGMWASIGKDAGFDVTLERTAPASVAEWFKSYRSHVNVVLDRSASRDTRLAALALPYNLQQIEHWRNTEVTLAPASDPRTRNIVVGDFRHSIEVRGNDLYVTNAGIGLLTKTIAPMLLTSVVDDAGAGEAPRSPQTRTLSLEQLGVAGATSSGRREIAFAIPFSIAAIGGAPDNLQLVLGMTHSALQGDQSGTVDVSVNGTLVRSYPLWKTGTAETFSVPIDASLVHALNQISIVTKFAGEQSSDVCVKPPSYTVSLSSGSFLKWTGLHRPRGGIGDFFYTAHGRMGLLVANGSLYPAAFALALQLGALNGGIDRIVPQVYSGSIPEGLDETMIVAPPASLTALKPSYLPQGQDFAIRDGDSAQVLYQASYRRPFGVLETVETTPIPTLLATYWSDPAILQGIATLAPRTIGSQNDSLFLFNRDFVAYGMTRRHVTQLREPPNPLAFIFYVMLGVGAIGIVGVVFLGTRQSQRHKKVAAGR